MFRSSWFVCNASLDTVERRVLHWRGYVVLEGLCHTGGVMSCWRGYVTLFPTHRPEARLTAEVCFLWRSLLFQEVVFNDKMGDELFSGHHEVLAARTQHTR